MTWTKTVPNKEGSYYICGGRWPVPVLVNIVFFCNRFIVLYFGTEEDEDLERLAGVWWMGPIPDPELPKE